jgi:Protein of unknown function (DUF5818)
LQAPFRKADVAGYSGTGLINVLITYDPRRKTMKKWVYLGLALLMSAGMSMAAPKAVTKGKTFVGSISDKMCGAKHMMGSSAKDCTLECVKAGSKFVLVDAKGKVYDLSDQGKPKEFAGAKVKVTGTLQGDTIEVSSIESAK